MRNQIIPTFFLLLIAFTTHSQPGKKEIVVTEGLTLIPLNNNIYQHVSDLATTDFGKVKCNGLIYINKKDAIICDTPATEALSEDLLNWMAKNHPNVTIKAVIVNHFHADCLAGLRLFHRAGIKSYAHNLAPELLKLKKDTSQIPQHLFSESLEIKVGNKKVVNYYAGEAHTRDNIITWIPSENIIFGGCMVKSMNATKGNLEDANVKEWSNTIRKIKLKYPDASTIVPGHGDAGGQELLDYTITLFE
jgi:metallo-beta-lactamase class B